MFEGVEKKITRWFLDVDGERHEFRLKKDAIRIGKMTIKAHNGSVKLIESERIWFGSVKSEMKQISYEEYDRTILIMK